MCRSVALEHLDGVPAQEALVYLALDALLDVGDGVLHAAVEHAGCLHGAVLARQLGRAQRRRLAALALEGAGGHHLAAERVAQLLEVDLVAVLAHDVYHVHGHHRRYAQLDELRGQIEVALYVRAVHDVDDGVRLFVHQVFAGHDLLQRVGGERIDAGQVLYDDVLRALEAPFLFLHRHAGPVAHALVGAGEAVEHRGLAAVRVAGKRDLHFHNDHAPLNS